MMSASCWARRSAGRPGVVTAMVRDPASLTFAGAADWLAGRCGAWVWGVGVGVGVPARGWQVMGPVARRGGAVS